MSTEIRKSHAKAMPASARGVGQICPTTSGIFAHRLGHSYPRTWSRIPVYVGMDAHVRGQKMMMRISRRRKAMQIAAA